MNKDINYVRKNKSHSLDTLEVTSDSFNSKNHEALYRSTLQKHSTINSLLKLIDVSDEVSKKQYWKTYHCRNVLLQDGNKLVGSLCRKRWCQTCNRIRTAELITAYHKPLQELQLENGLYLVTLTAPTVKARNLSSEIDKRYKAFTRAKDNLRKNYGIKLVGGRKLEVAYNKEEDKYHPHFHLVQQGKHEAQMLQNLWLDQFPKASIKAQDITIVDAKNPENLLEVFKYATKGTTKDEIDAKANHIIYTALKGRRIFQTYGKLSKVKEPVEAREENSVVDFIPPKREIYVYEHHLKDYTNANFETLIGTKQIERNLIKHKEI
jgi:plasmid rolling circle replication initiator protein Rep